MIMRPVILPALLAVLLLGYARPSTAAFYAYSLAQAQARAQQGGHTEERVATLGGMNILAGMVYDPTSQDVILIGQHMPGQPPATLDDLVVALRALLVHQTSPLVSIDPTADTPRTGVQMVRFEGGLANTQYGADLLAADILLKRISLSLTSANVPQISSYLQLAAAQRTQSLADDDLTVSSRFWFTLGKDSALVERNGERSARLLPRLALGSCQQQSCDARACG